MSLKKGAWNNNNRAGQVNQYQVSLNQPLIGKFWGRYTKFKKQQKQAIINILIHQYVVQFIWVPELQLSVTMMSWVWVDLRLFIVYYSLIFW